MEDKQHWALDKKVPMALIITTVVQIAFLAFWVGEISRDIDYLKAANIERSKHAVRIVRLETEYEAINKLLERIDTKLDRMKEK